jgi:microcystin-dependent protein
LIDFNNFFYNPLKITLGEIIMAQPFLGMVCTYSFNFAPKGWALCNGQLLSISQNVALFSLIGTTYGGDGVTNFALPNLQSRIALHMGQGSGLSPYEIGENGGLENITLTTNQMPEHSHPANASNSGANTPNPSGNSLAVEPTGLSAFYQTGTPATPMNASTIGHVGGGQPHSNIQPYLALNFCIALQGIFPTEN